MDKNPKVFICHSSKDKERFVRDFATKLIDNGVDTWFDEWEIKLGDSLASKIFEGIKECDFFIIILSKNSVKSKWVKEELDSATIKRIEEKTRIIPIIIDNIGEDEIPYEIKHLHWIKINEDNYEEGFKKVINTIFNVNEKPPLGNKPKFVTYSSSIPDLEKVDSIILETLGNLVYEKDDIGEIISCSNLLKLLENYKLSEEEVYTSLDILDNMGLINFKKIHPIGASYLYFTPEGYFKYLQYSIENFDTIVKDIVSVILNYEPKSSADIQKKLNYKKSIIYSVLEYFSSLGYLKTEPLWGANLTAIIEITGAGRREFKKMLEN